MFSMRDAFHCNAPNTESPFFCKHCTGMIGVCGVVLPLGHSICVSMTCSRLLLIPRGFSAPLRTQAILHGRTLSSTRSWQRHWSPLQACSLLISTHFTRAVHLLLWGLLVPTLSRPAAAEIGPCCVSREVCVCDCADMNMFPLHSLASPKSSPEKSQIEFTLLALNFSCCANHMAVNCVQTFSSLS